MNQFDRESRYAIVTGAAGGLGRAFCTLLARESSHLAIVDIDAAGAEETRQLVEGAGGAGRVELCDVTDPAAWRSLRDRLQKDWPRIDLLVNNAGMFASGEIGSLDLAEAQRVVRLNLLSVLYGCETLVPWLVAGNAAGDRRRGPFAAHVINVASVFAYYAPPGMAVYSMTKAGVIALSETLYNELRPRGIGVTVVCPGVMPTRFAERATFGSDAFRRLTESYIHQSTLTPEAVAASALDGANRGQLYVVVGPRERWYWRLKRLAPAAFLRESGKRVRRALAAASRE
jgi:short-subunit dehydrogenase